MRRALLSALLSVVTPLLLVGGTPAFAAGSPPRPASHTVAGAHAARSTKALHGTVNLNQADAAQIELLPGVGPSKAARIVAWRKAHPFHKVAELTRVHGFGRKTLVRLQPYLSVNGPSTLAIEKAGHADPAGSTSTTRNTATTQP